MKKAVRMSPQTLSLLEEFLAQPAEWRYGYNLSRETGLKSGTLYPILMRLARHQWLETKWEATEEGTPPRHMYRLTPDGLELARERVREARPRRGAQRAAYAEGRI
ncbi:MAG TPA: PadR family transcriptional regulator [Terriglobia bacterium]|nr:PadR family transcriptional regulator [Terriglobia bacterium]